MIKNEKQRMKSLELSNEIEKKIKTSNKESEIESLKIIKSDIDNEINEYINIKNGRKKIFHFDNMQKIPELLINARIAKKLSQKELAQIVGVSQQQLHRWESTDYETASFWRLLDISEALELKININASLDDENLHTIENIFSKIEKNICFFGVNTETEKISYFNPTELNDIDLAKSNVIGNNFNVRQLIYSDRPSTFPSGNYCMKN